MSSVVEREARAKAWIRRPPPGELLFHVFGALAQYERAFTRERVMAGLTAARRRGRVGGRPPVIVGEKLDAILAALDGGMSKAAVCRQLRRQAYYVDRDAGPDRYGSICRCQFGMTSRVGAPDESWTLTPEDHSRVPPRIFAACESTALEPVVSSDRVVGCEFAPGVPVHA